MDSTRTAGSCAPGRFDVSARWARATAAGLVAAVALVAVPFIGSAYTLQLATDVLTFVTLACAWNLISGFTGYVSFGQVSFFGIGAYTTALLVLHTAVPWYLAVIAAAAVGGVAGLALGAIMLKLRGILFALGMFGLARILTVIASNWTFAGGAVGLTLPAQLTPVAVYAGMAAAAVCAFGVNVFFSRSGFGLDAMSVRDDEDAAAALGVPTTRVKIVAFVLSAIFPAVAGGLVAWSRSFMDPISAFDPGIDLRVVVFTLFGGIGTLWGPLLGSLVLMIVAEQLWAHLPELELALFGALIIAVVLTLPGGLVGLANRFGRLRRRMILAPAAFPDVESPPTPAVPDRAEPVLDVQDVTVRFGGVVALQHVSFRVRSGETVSIIGANGAGKTTLFNVVTGFVTPSEGAVAYYGARISGLPPFELARRGIGRTFQIPRLMESMSVWENVVLASRHGRQWRNSVRHAAWALATVRLESLWREPAQNLTPGQRRRLEFARVLALQPTIVLLDEVMAGMTRDEQDEIRDVIRRLKDLGVAAVAGVEHVVSAIRDLSDRMIVLDFGKKIAEGVPEAVLRDPVVVRAYLGEAPKDRGAHLPGGTAVTSPSARLGGEPALVVEELVSGVGPLTILHGVSLEVGTGEVTVVLGANGAGKTTLLRTIAGILAPRAGHIRLFGESITDRPAHLVTRAGIGHVPSGRELFPRLPVADHLELGGRLCDPARRAELRERALELLPALRPLLRQNAGSLSGGEQQMLAIARALMTDPRVLLLDEPSTGLAPKVVLSVFETLPRLLEQGMSVLLVEQSLSLALSAARRAYVIDDGRIVLSGTAAELAADPRVVKAYLGS